MISGADATREVVETVALYEESESSGGKHYRAILVDFDAPGQSSGRTGWDNPCCAAYREARSIDAIALVLEAMKEFLRENPESTIQALFHVYENLSEEEERAVFERYNRGVRATLADKVTVTQDDFPILKMMKRDFPTPVTIAGPKADENGIRFLSIAQAHAERFRTSTMGGARMSETIGAIKRQGKDDYETMKAFMEDFIYAFGHPSKTNRFASKVGLAALYRVWFVNLKVLGRVEVRKRFAERVADDAAVKNWLGTRAMTILRELQGAIVTAMNRGRSKVPAITPDEAKALAAPTTDPSAKATKGGEST